ncbi:MAG TPA: glycosyltransferase family 4 protein [Thermoanaerobaculia bacterium]|nr:glycosyltransferase family 4 protein [Thermoanaerobaculia bacterium]HQR68014.1 glycosyltransferase family 4 protein [Thermoanaerobaculia bacterium]
MARVLVCSAQVPFASGGAERHAAGLVRELKAAGHEAELVQLPFKWYPRPEILASAMAWRLLDVTEADGKRIDLVIPMKFPSYLVRHPNKVVWLIHQFRQAYDRFGTAQSDFTASPEDTRWRELILEADRTGLTEARKIFTNARNTAERLRRFNGIAGEPLYHPPPLAGRYRSAASAGYALAAGRLDPWKRVDLAIEAAAAGRFPLVVAGTGPDEERLKRLAGKSGAEVSFRGAVTDEELLELYAAAGAVLFTPADEDFGYIALEAFLSKKPVVTCSDSGGPLEFVTDGETGRVTPPEGASLGEATAALLSDGAAARRLGEAGFERVRGITWTAAVAALLSAGGVA